MSLGVSGNPTVQGRQAKAESMALRLNMDALKAVLETPAGRRTLWWLIEEANVHGATGYGAGLEYLTGKRDFGVEIQEWCKDASPELYTQMVLDRLQEENTQKQLKEAAESDGDERE